MSTHDSLVPSEVPTPNRATRRAQGQRSSRTRKLGALGSGAVLASGAAAAMLGATATPAGATTFTVTAATDDCMGVTGTLSDAIDQANMLGGEDVIDFAVPGPTIMMSCDLPKIEHSVHITGPGAAALTLDLNTHCGFYVYGVNGVTDTPTISGLTIKNGDSNGCKDGGGISLYGNEADVVVDAVVLSENHSAGDGGAIWCYGETNTGSLTVTNSTIDYNDANSTGGGIAMFCDGDLTITNTTISNNTGVDAGGVEASNYGDATVTGSTISLNGATGDGGGLDFDNYGSATISETTISDNTSLTGSGGVDAENYMSLAISASTFDHNTSNRAGGLYVANHGDATITTSTFSNNTATGGGGGGVMSDIDALTISNSTFSNNHAAGGWGGGLYASNSSVSTTILQSTFTGNDACFGGGIALATGDLSIVQSTISGNTSQTGGGLYLYTNNGGGVCTRGSSVTSKATRKADMAANEATNDEHTKAVKTSGEVGGLAGVAGVGTVDLTGTIISANVGDDIGADGTITLTSNHSLFGTLGTGVMVTDAGGTQTGVTTPGLGALASNGGPTQTMALLAGSPAINAGPDPLTSFTGNGFDQRGSGFPRVVNGRVDIGAYELQANGANGANEVPADGRLRSQAVPATPLALVPRFTG